MAVIYQDDYNRKKRAARDADAQRTRADAELADAKKTLRNIEQQGKAGASADLRAFMQQVSDTQRQADEELTQVSEELRLAIGRQAEEYRRQVEQLRRQAEAADRRLDGMESELAELSRRFGEQFRALAEREQSQKQRAAVYEAELARICREIAGLHPDRLEPQYQELLAPGTATLTDSLPYLRLDIRNGDYQAAIGVAQTRIPEALYIRTQLELLNAEYQRARAAAVQSAAAAGQRRGEAAGLLGLSVQDYVSDRDADFWSDGMFTPLDAELRVTGERQAAFDEDMDIEGLRLVRTDFERLAARFALCREIGETQFLFSCRTQDAAEAVWNALADSRSAWTVQDGAFFGDDYRSAYVLSLADGFGYSARVVISPRRETGRPGASEYDVAVFDSADGVRNPVICADMRRGLIAALRAAGIAVGDGGRERQDPSQDGFCTQIAGQCDRRRAAWVAAMQQRAEHIGAEK